VGRVEEVTALDVGPQHCGRQAQVLVRPGEVGRLELVERSLTDLDAAVQVAGLEVRRHERVGQLGRLDVVRATS
jgi:hypothetical protein